MIKFTLKMITVFCCTIVLAQSITAQNFPANGTEAEEIAIGGPNSDYLTLQFPRPGVDKCAPYSSETRTIAGELAKGKALLVVIFPKDCPYCIEAADIADVTIDKYRDKLIVWYVNQRLNGDGSCADITEMSNKYKFVKNADFKFIDIYMMNATFTAAVHYGGQDSYWSRKESPSVYRIFDPKSKKVTGINYFVGQIDNQIAAAVNNNFIPTGAEVANENLESYEVFPNPVNDNLNLNINLKSAANALVSIKNMLGVEVLKKDLGNSNSFNPSINISALNSDMYMIQVITDGNVLINDKFVKQ